MVSMLKKISLAGHGILLLCFLLPFVSMSCDKHKIRTFAAHEFVTGTTIDTNGKIEKVQPERYAIAALCAAVVGFIFSLFQGKVSQLLVLSSSGLGAAAIYLLKQKLDGDILQAGKGLLVLDYEPGYYIMLAVFIGLAIASLLIIGRLSNSNNKSSELSINTA